MRMFKTTLYLLAVIPLLTGTLDLALGLPGQRLIGARVSPEALSDPLLNSQIRFVATVGIELVGMPLLLWWHWRVDG